MCTASLPQVSISSFNADAHYGCLVLFCMGRYGLGGVVLLFILGSNLGGVGLVRVCKVLMKSGVRVVYFDN